MIPDRAPTQRTTDLTMLRYQERCMAPVNPSNRDQRRLAYECQPTPAQAIPKKIGRPLGSGKKKVEDTNRRISETVSQLHDRRIKAQVAELFKAGPLTVKMIQTALKLSIYQSAGRKVFDWKNRGLIKIVKGPKIEGDGRAQQARWWGLCNAEITGG